MGEIYFSVDIETDGPIPGVNSMLSLGAAAFTEQQKENIGTFSINLQELEGAVQDPDTMKWWEDHPEAWKISREHPWPPEIAMQNFVKWVLEVCGEGNKPVFVGYPAGFDFLFVYWYIIKFLGSGKSPFSFSALDIKSFAMAVMGCEYRKVSKKTMHRFIPKELSHSHVAVDDATEQGHLFLNLLKANKSFHEVEVYPKKEWHEDDGAVLWWVFPVEEPPYCGTPSNEDFPIYVTHWTRLQVPQPPKISRYP